MKENKNNMNANEFTNKQKSNTLLHRLQVHKLSKSKKKYLNKFKTHATCYFNVRQDRRPIWTDTKNYCGLVGRSVRWIVVKAASQCAFQTKLYCNNKKRKIKKNTTTKNKH